MTLSDLTSHVFGPYPEHVLLNPAFPPPRSGAKIPMRDLQMYFVDESDDDAQLPVGFDQTEFIVNPPPKSAISKNPNGVIFFGVIEIEDLNHLSKKGLEFVEEDFKRYDAKIHLSHLNSQWNMRKSFGQVGGPRLKVRVGCIKNLLAHYLTTDSDPEKLLIFSKYENINRTYWVQSLNVSTYKQSRNFLERFRLRALITELIDTDSRKTPLQDRDIDWLIDRYKHEIRPRDATRQRLITLTSLSPEIESEPRRLRHIPHAEIRGWFAKHADWLLANQLASNSYNARLVDIPKWINFCKQARNDSLEAGRNGIKWGPDTTTAAYDRATQLATYGQTVEFWAQQLKIVSQQRTSKQKQIPPAPERSMVDVPVQPTFTYDSDFSEPTTEEESSDSDSDAVSPLVNKIPRALFVPPSLPTGQFMWHCSICNHIIDLLDMPAHYKQLLPPEVVRVLDGRSWKVTDDPIREALYLMVSDHYTKDHLNAAGLFLVEKGDGYRLRGPEGSTSTSHSRKRPHKVKKEGTELEEPHMPQMEGQGNKAPETGEASFRRSGRKLNPRTRE